MGTGAWGVDVAVAEDLAVLLGPYAFFVVTLKSLHALGISFAVQGCAFLIHTLLASRAGGPLITIGAIILRLGQRVAFAGPALETSLARRMLITVLDHASVTPAHVALGAVGPLVAVERVLEVTDLAQGC